jgi:hypothetical protein
VIVNEFEARRISASEGKGIENVANLGRGGRAIEGRRHEIEQE